MTSWVLLVLLIPSLQTFAQPAPSRQDTPTRLVVGQPLTGVIDDGAPVVETETLAARYRELAWLRTSQINSCHY